MCVFVFCCIIKSSLQKHSRPSDGNLKLEVLSEVSDFYSTCVYVHTYHSVLFPKKDVLKITGVFLKGTHALGVSSVIYKSRKHSSTPTMDLTEAATVFVSRQAGIEKGKHIRAGWNADA